VCAKSQSGYFFDAWNVTSGSATIQAAQMETTLVIVNSDATIKARFVEAGSVRLTGISSGAYVYSNATSGWVGKLVKTGSGIINSIKPGIMTIAISEEGKRTEYVTITVPEGSELTDTIELHDASPLIFGSETVVKIAGKDVTIGPDESVACDDLDRDGDRDLAILRGNGDVELYETRNTEFSLKKIVSTKISDANCLRVADLNSDGFPDLLISSSANGIMHIPGCGSFCFRDTVITLKTGGCTGFSIVNYQQTTLPVFAIGKPDGTVVIDNKNIEACDGSVIDVGSDAKPLFIDLSGDGKDDMVLIDSTGIVVWFRYDPSGDTCFKAMGPVNANGKSIECMVSGTISFVYGDEGELPEMLYAGKDGVLRRITAQLRGDFDGDGTVGFSDYMLFVNAWNLSETDTTWVPLANMTITAGEQKIDFADYLLFVGSWGKIK
jgi:hypothetical protein